MLVEKMGHPTINHCILVLEQRERDDVEHRTVHW